MMSNTYGTTCHLRKPFWLLMAMALTISSALAPVPMILKGICTVLSICILLFIPRSVELDGKFTIMGFCLAAAIGTITVCSKSSFLYPLNDWVDANCFFTVGKSMMNGVVMYRDLLEQKGPYLYFLHGLAWLVSHDSFIGVYLIEVLAAAFFLYFSYQSLCLLTSPRQYPFLIPIMALAVYTAPSFCHGDSVEELSLPLLAYAMWLGLDAICNHKEISPKQFLLIGITSGLIFWSKFTLVGFYIGWYVFPVYRYIKNRNWKALFTSASMIFCGIVIVTLPWVVYFGMHHAISDWLTVYIFENLFSYSSVDTQTSLLSTLQRNILNGMLAVLFSGPHILTLIVIGIWYTVHQSRPVALYLVITAACAFTFIYIGGRHYPYYAFALSIFAPPGLLLFIPFYEKISRSIKSSAFQRYVIPGILALSIITASFAASNRYLMGTAKEELPQYKFASIIGTDGSATVLNYGFLDGGFYTVTNTIPNCRVFCQLNMNPERLLMVQDSYVEQGLCDYVITRDHELDSSNYELAASSSLYFEGYDFTYRLYVLR